MFFKMERTPCHYIFELTRKGPKGGYVSHYFLEANTMEDIPPDAKNIRPATEGCVLYSNMIDGSITIHHHGLRNADDSNGNKGKSGDIIPELGFPPTQAAVIKLK